MGEYTEYPDREDLARYRKVTSEQADELERLGAHTSSLADENARYRALVEQLNRELELEARCVEARDRSIAELKSKLAEVERERDELHAELKAVVDIAIDEVGMPTSAMLGASAPSRVMRKLLGERNEYRRLLKCAEDGGRTALSELAQVKAERDELMDTNGTLLKNASMATNELAQVKARLDAVEKVYDRWRRGYEHIAKGFQITGNHNAEVVDGYYQGMAKALLNCDEYHALSTSQPAKETK